MSAEKRAWWASEGPVLMVKLLGDGALQRAVPRVPTYLLSAEQYVGAVEGEGNG